MHGHAAVLFDAAEVLDGPSRRLAEEGEGHDQLAGPPGVLRAAAGLVLLKGPVEDVLESLYRLRVLDLHGVWEENGTITVSNLLKEGRRKLKDERNDWRSSDT